jgi:hypothetical protein
LIYFTDLYEDRVLKPVDIILNKRERDEGEWW